MQLLSTEKSFIVMAPNNQQRMDWISKIDEARACLSSERSSQVNKGAAPVWMPDHTSEDCVVCRASFSIWRRRHHCKSCGSLVCAQHSRNKVLLPHVNASESQRVCDICFNSLRPAGIEQYQETERDMEDDSDFVVTSSQVSFPHTAEQGHSATKHICGYFCPALTTWPQGEYA